MEILYKSELEFLYKSELEFLYESELEFLYKSELEFLYESELEFLSPLTTNTGLGPQVYISGHELPNKTPGNQEAHLPG